MNNKDELLEALRFYYGMNKKEGQKWLKEASDEAKKELIKGYDDQLKLSFYED